jgi:hypothetical protein
MALRSYATTNRKAASDGAGTNSLAGIARGNGGTLIIDALGDSAVQLPEYRALLLRSSSELMPSAEEGPAASARPPGWHRITDEFVDAKSCS